MKACEVCEDAYPGHLIQPLIVGPLRREVCPICALDISNELDGFHRSEFKGEVAESLRQEALRYREQQGGIMRHHTAEPWCVWEPEFNATPASGPCDNILIAREWTELEPNQEIARVWCRSSYFDGEPEEEVYSELTEATAPPTAIANARRIVAAVNACKGLSDESLEMGVVAELIAACTAALDALGGNDPHDLGFESAICGQLRAAIANARGEES